MNPGDLVRIVHAGDAQPREARLLVGKVGLVLRVGYNRVLEVMVEGTIHQLHPLDVERA